MRRVVLALGFAWLGAAACGAPEPRTASAVAGLVDYTPEEAAYFGDTLSATLFGLPVSSSEENDSKLATRALRADTIVPVRVATVTREQLAGTEAYVLTLTPEGPPLAGRRPPDPLELAIRAASPALFRVQAADSKLVGARFVVFLRRYAEGGEPTLHFHGESDSPQLRERVKAVKRLDAPGAEVQTPP